MKLSELYDRISEMVDRDPSILDRDVYMLEASSGASMNINSIMEIDVRTAYPESGPMLDKSNDDIIVVIAGDA